MRLVVGRGGGTLTEAERGVVGVGGERVGAGGPAALDRGVLGGVASDRVRVGRGTTDSSGVGIPANRPEGGEAGGGGASPSTSPGPSRVSGDSGPEP